MFTVEDRERVRERVLALASGDARVVAGAIVGSLAHDQGDRWSDLDLTFAVRDDVPLADVLDDWTRRLGDELGAVALFDLPSGPSLYRVLLVRGGLEVDLSVTPASQFGPTSQRFRLLFGKTCTTRPFPETRARDLLGYAVHHVLHARVAIERGRPWQAEYWVSAARDYALALACRRRGLPTRESRGVDDLPADVRTAFEDALVRSLDREALLRALARTIAILLCEAGEARELAEAVAPQLESLTTGWDEPKG